jgi:hypothetical protein
MPNTREFALLSGQEELRGGEALLLCWWLLSSSRLLLSSQSAFLRVVNRWSPGGVRMAVFRGKSASGNTAEGIAWVEQGLRDLWAGRGLRYRVQWTATGCVVRLMSSFFLFFFVRPGMKVYACAYPTGTSNGGSTCRVTGTSNRSAGNT